MDTRSLFESLLKRYSALIELTDGIHNANGTMKFPTLTAEHDREESFYIGKSDEHAAMGWAIYQCLHTTATELYRRGISQINVTDISFESVCSRYKRNLEAVKEHKNAPTT